MGEVQDARDVHKTVAAPAVKPFEHYDFSRAKIRCSLTWLVAKAYGTDSIPTDLKDPFYTDQYEQEHLKPPVTSLLLSADLYCRAGSLILKSDAAKPLLSHDAVIQSLAQRGLYVTDQERLVTERDLRKRPLQMLTTGQAVKGVIPTLHLKRKATAEKRQKEGWFYTSKRIPDK